MRRAATPRRSTAVCPSGTPHVVYMRDRPEPPDYARILARDAQDRARDFPDRRSARSASSAHPGFKVAMAEDLIMEFEEAPADPGADARRACAT